MRWEQIHRNKIQATSQSETLEDKMTNLLFNKGESIIFIILLYHIFNVVKIMDLYGHTLLLSNWVLSTVLCTKTLLFGMHGLRGGGTHQLNELGRDRTANWTGYNEKWGLTGLVIEMQRLNRLYSWTERLWTFCCYGIIEVGQSFNGLI